MTIANSTNLYGPSAFIVDPTSGNGTHTTIAAALTAASSGQDIFIRPGTYTENPTLKAGVNLIGWTGDDISKAVIINGTCTLSTAGTVSISNVTLQTNSAAAVIVSGSVASVLYLEKCFINASNNTAITYSSSSASSVLQLDYCQGNLGTTGIAYFAHSSAGTMTVQFCNLANSGLSTTASTVSAGQLNMDWTAFLSQITTSSTAGFSQMWCSMFQTTNATALTLGNSGNCRLKWCQYDCGTSTAVTVNNTATMDGCSISSSNTNAIGGTGTLDIGDTIFYGTSSTIAGTVTVTPLMEGPVATSSIIINGGTPLTAYAEGTWNPTLIGSTTAGTSTYTNQQGSYVKIGRMVLVQCNVSGTTGGTAAGNLLIGGLPFTTSATQPSGLCTAWANADIALTSGYTQFYVSPGNVNNSTGALLQWGSGKSVALYAVAASTQYSIQFDGCYYTT